MTQRNFKSNFNGNYLLCISFLLVADRFIYKLSKFAKSHSSLNILIVQMSDIYIACGKIGDTYLSACLSVRQSWRPPTHLFIYLSARPYLTDY